MLFLTTLSPPSITPTPTSSNALPSLFYPHFGFRRKYASNGFKIACPIRVLFTFQLLHLNHYRYLKHCECVPFFKFSVCLLTSTYTNKVVWCTYVLGGKPIKTVFVSTRSSLSKHFSAGYMYDFALPFRTTIVSIKTYLVNKQRKAVNGIKHCEKRLPLK